MIQAERALQLSHIDKMVHLKYRPTRRVVVSPATAPTLIKIETNFNPLDVNASANGASSPSK